MVWSRDRLTDAKIRTVKPGPRMRKLSDGRGLQLWIMPQGGRHWRLEYRHLGKRKLLALGSYPEISLASARSSADDARRQIRDGLDPASLKQQRKAEVLAAADNTFARIAERLVAKKRKSGRAPVTITKMEWILAKLRPAIGHNPIASITTPQIVQALKAEEEAGNLETARRMRTVIGEVFRFAMQHRLVTGDPSTATRGAIAVPKTPAPCGHYRSKGFGGPASAYRRLCGRSCRDR